MASSPGKLCVSGFGGLQEAIDDTRVEVRPRLDAQPLQSHPEREGNTVGSVHGHRVIGIRDPQDPGKQGDLFSLQAVGISPSVMALMMGSHGLARDLWELMLSQDLLSADRVEAHQVKLPAAQPAGFFQDLRRHVEFPDVVKQGSHLQPDEIALRQSHAAGNRNRQTAHPL
jgi:hypothetical protein